LTLLEALTRIRTRPVAPKIAESTEGDRYVERVDCNQTRFPNQGFSQQPQLNEAQAKSNPHEMSKPIGLRRPDR